MEETLEEVLASGETALLFTQYAEFGDLLRTHLGARFGREVGYLRGGLGKGQRDDLAARCQDPDGSGPSLFVLSLKAGGTGLTLTAANHVIHVDRWWNPAVEDQATDRAFRIGQTRSVQVRKLVCAGTLEEKIALMTKDKRGLAASLVGTGEGWLTELSTSALRERRALVVTALPRGAAVLGAGLATDPRQAQRPTGSVLSLEVAPGVVTASVQGSPKTPYKVSITLPAFSELVWPKVEVTLAEQAIHSARLLAGEMPHDLEEVFLAAGAPLFPQRAKDLTLSCFCPDWEVPCKHLAATFYPLAESFDDPFAILLWRGRSRTALLNRLRERRGSDTAHRAVEPAGPTTEGPRVGAMMALADLVLADGDFWTGAPVPALPVHAELPTDLLLRQLPVPGAPLGGPGLVTYLAPLYAVFGESPDLARHR